jgi:hypothetical protein
VDEPGYSPEEIERGDDNPGCAVTAHPVGCLLYTALLALLIYGAYCFAIWLGFAASVGL